MKYNVHQTSSNIHGDILMLTIKRNGDLWIYYELLTKMFYTNQFENEYEFRTAICLDYLNAIKKYEHYMRIYMRFLRTESVFMRGVDFCTL